MVPEYISASDEKLFLSFSRLLIAYLQSPNLIFFDTGYFPPNPFCSVNSLKLLQDVDCKLLGVKVKNKYYPNDSPIDLGVLANVPW